MLILDPKFKFSKMQCLRYVLLFVQFKMEISTVH